MQRVIIPLMPKSPEYYCSPGRPIRKAPSPHSLMTNLSKPTSLILYLTVGSKVVYGTIIIVPL